MGYRLSKIYTRTGDQGATGLADGSRVDKDDARIEAMGCVDELNSIIGVLLSTMPGAQGGADDAGAEAGMRGTLTAIQHDLFDLGSELAVPGSVRMEASRVGALEQTLDRLNAELAPLREFILPGGCLESSLAHLARTVCRRAERRLCSCAKVHELNPVSVRYLNRLSDLLFVMARAINKSRDHDDVLWHNRPPPSAD